MHHTGQTCCWEQDGGATSWPSAKHERGGGKCHANSNVILRFLDNLLLIGEVPVSRGSIPSSPQEKGQEHLQEAHALEAITAFRMMKMFVNGDEVKG